MHLVAKRQGTGRGRVNPMEARGVLLGLGDCWKDLFPFGILDLANGNHVFCTEELGARIEVLFSSNSRVTL